MDEVFNNVLVSDYSDYQFTWSLEVKITNLKIILSSQFIKAIKIIIGLVILRRNSWLLFQS